MAHMRRAARIKARHAHARRWHANNAQSLPASPPSRGRQRIKQFLNITPLLRALHLRAAATRVTRHRMPRQRERGSAGAAAISYINAYGQRLGCLMRSVNVTAPPRACAPHHLFITWRGISLARRHRARITTWRVPPSPVNVTPACNARQHCAVASSLLVTCVCKGEEGGGKPMCAGSMALPGTRGARHRNAAACMA